MGATHLVLVGVGTQLGTPELHTPAAPLLGVGVVMATLSVLLGLPVVRLGLPAPTRAIVRWAFAETATLLGLVASMSGGVMYLYAGAAFGLLAWGAAFPTDAASWSGDSGGRREG